MNLGVWYHCRLAGGHPAIHTDFALQLMLEQMQALVQSGLLAKTSAFYVGCNGSEQDAWHARFAAPPPAQIVVHGPNVASEIPTLKHLQSWLPSHRDWFVFYHHSKGVTHPGLESYQAWRRRMENACVWNWKRCVADLQAGYDAVGCHWLTPEKFRAAVTSPFFGGTFWWAKASYLVQLPALPEPTWKNRFEAESWIGRRRPYPRVMDYYPGWP